MFNVFGSKTSLDLDVYFVIDTPLSIVECHTKCNAYSDNKELLAYGKPLNINLCTIKNGIITWVFKGLKDESNNALYRTYSLHKQVYPCVVDHLVERDVELKLARSTRVLLSQFSRSQYREKVKIALKLNTVKDRLLVLKEIKLSSVDWIKLRGTLVDLYKLIAFQIGQCLALENKIELYSKEAISEHYPQLAPYINREECTVDVLESYMVLFCDLIERTMTSNPTFQNKKEILV